MPTKKLEVVIAGDAGSAKKAFQELAASADKSGKSVEKSSSGISKALGTVGKIAGGVALVGFLKASVGEAQEAQKAHAQLTAVIKSTGGAANVTAGHVESLATKISNMSGIDDEAVSSASSLLLTFKNIRNEAGKNNDVFDQATQATVDMSVAMGTDLKSAAILVGKALNDPIRGLTALQRVGVTFTAQQKKQITALVESGRTLDAQKIILKEFNSEFGGSAKASATALDKAKVSIGNFEESIGTALAPALDAGAFFAAGRAMRLAVPLRDTPCDACWMLSPVCLRALPAARRSPRARCCRSRRLSCAARSWMLWHAAGTWR